MSERLLYTGASGFLGHNTLPLLRQHYRVTTLGPTAEDELRYDLAASVPCLPERYDIVLHAAGKAHVIPRTEEEKQAFFAVNYGGTQHLCEALEQAGLPRALVFISTVAVYGTEEGEEIAETHPLEGGTPYADSKIQAEQYLQDWCRRHSVTLTVLRPALLAGQGAPGNLGSMVHGIRKGFYFNIDGGLARRSIFLASDIARLLPLVADKGGVYNLADNRQPSFGELAMRIAELLGKGRPPSLPLPLARLMARTGDLLGPKCPFNSLKLHKMTHSLTFSNRRLREDLAFEPSDVITHFNL